MMMVFILALRRYSQSHQQATVAWSVGNKVLSNGPLPSVAVASRVVATHQLCLMNQMLGKSASGMWTELFMNESFAV